MTAAPAAESRPLPRYLTNRALAVLIAAVTATSFLPVLADGFVSWDDPKNFVDNPHYRGLGPAQLRWMFTTLHMGHYIPLTWVTLGLDYLLWGMNPAGYHLTNLLLHTATALSLYFLALRLLRLALPAGTAEADLRVGAAAAALLWAVHPLRVESVAWLTERRDVLSGLFYVTAALAYLTAAGPDAGDRVRRRRWYWASLALFAASLLSKSITVTLPVTLLALDVYPLRRLGGPSGWRRWDVWLEKAPFFAIAGLVSVVAFVALLPLGNAHSLRELGVLQRTVLSVYGLAFYLFKTVVPLDLSPLYLLIIEVTWLHFATVIGGTVLATVVWRRWPAFTTVWVVYVVTVFPVLGFFHNGPQAAADRYTYLSCLGWALLAGGLLARRWVGLRVARAIVVVWLLTMAWLTWQQAGVWHDSFTLWRQALVVDPDNRAAHFNLGGVYEEEGRYAEALGEYLEVLRLSRGDGRWYVTIGWLYEKAGVDRGAEESFREALRRRPGLPDACDGLQRVLARMGKRPETPEGCPRAK